MKWLLLQQVPIFYQILQEVSKWPYPLNTALELIKEIINKLKNKTIKTSNQEIQDLINSQYYF